MLFSASVIHGQFQEREGGVWEAYRKWGNGSQVVTLRQWQRIVRHICNVAGLKISKRSFSFNRSQVSHKATPRRKRFKLEPGPSPSGRERYVSSVCKYLSTHTHTNCYLDSPCKSTKIAPNLERRHPVRVWNYLGVYYSLLELEFNWNNNNHLFQRGNDLVEALQTPSLSPSYLAIISPV